MTKILITEKQLQRLSKRVLKEQTVAPTELVQIYMTNDLNTILQSKISEAISSVKATFSPNQPNINFNVGQEVFECYEYGGGWVHEFTNQYQQISRPGFPPERVKVPLFTIPSNLDMDSIFEELKNLNEDYKSFFSVKDEITDFVERQIKGFEPSIAIYFQNGQYETKLVLEAVGKRKFATGNIYQFNEELTLLDIFESNSSLQLGKKFYANIKTDNWSYNLAKVQINFPAHLLPQKPEGGTPQEDTPCECKDVSTGEMIKYPCSGPLPEECKQDIIIPTFSVMGTSLPYADNMVMPYFDRYPDAQDQFDKIVDAFVKYINAGGGDKLTNVTIKGSADSARPTEKGPSWNNGKLDHPGGVIYGGITGNKERNQYLADTRAQEYANALIKAIKDRTGFNLNIKRLEGDNYYGQEGKRGKQFRKITLEPNAPTHSGTPIKK